MKELGVSRDAIVSYRKVKPKALQSLELDRLKGPLRLEINQENALTELSLQMADYSNEYKSATFPEDKQKWGALRLRCLETMIKVTGLDKGMPQAPNAEKNTVTVKWISSRQIPQVAEGTVVTMTDSNGKNEQSVKLVKV